MSSKGSNVPDTITITDDRTGKTVTVPISGGVFPASAVRELDPSLYIYDPAYMQTAACKSAITYLDGDAGILRYRGYPIEQLAEKSTYLETAYLIVHGELDSGTRERHIGRRRVTAACVGERQTAVEQCLARPAGGEDGILRHRDEIGPSAGFDERRQSRRKAKN